MGNKQIEHNLKFMYLLAHFLGLEIANLFGGIDSNVDRLIVTNGLSGHKLA